MQFRDPDSLLRWAYSLSDRPIIASAHLLESGRRRGDRALRQESDLSAWERVAQAAQVRAMVDRLDPAIRAYAEGYYGHRVEDAVRALVDWLAVDGDRRPYEIMVEQYLTGKVGIGEIRRLMHCRKTQALGRRREIWARMSSIHARLVDALSSRLEGSELAG